MIELASITKLGSVKSLRTGWGGGMRMMMLLVPTRTCFGKQSEATAPGRRNIVMNQE
jgi:hypothetical protein